MTKDQNSPVKNLLLSLRVWMRWGMSKRGFWTRALLCWLLACLLLKFDEAGVYDYRFKLRGPQKINDSVVLVTVKPRDFVKILDLKTSSLINVNESNEISDSFFWDQTLWFNLIEQILKQKPASVGVTLFFGENIGSTRLNSNEILTFKDPKVFWATNSRDFEKLSLPFATRPDRSNIGHIDQLKDDDGIVRRLFNNSQTIPNLAEKIAHASLLKNVRSPVANAPRNSSDLQLPTVNFKNTQDFNNYTLNDIFNKKISADAFTNKIVLIGIEKTLNSQIMTPLGEYSRHEFWGTVIDNILDNSFIKRLPIWIYMLSLLLLMFICVFIITNYTQTITFFAFAWIITIWGAFSIWVFDTFHIWVPVVSPIAMLILIWVMYVGYQALRIEQAHNRLQQEQRYLSDLEQLKSNFVSLISHDLKTPLAKIQAVVDRLSLSHAVAKETPPAAAAVAATETMQDYTNLKEYTGELNRYIQSILKVLRVESREFKILKETADLNTVIENAVDRLLPLANSKSITIHLNLEPMFLIEFDVTLMTEVIQNLIENAIKYTSADGQIHITSTETETDVLVTIRDTGEGISPEDQQLIWKKFVRGKNQELKTKGSGLGLYLVKYFIELHGGKISLKSEIGKGTTFYISLPIDS